MKKKRITYGINGFMDYQVVINVGKSHLNIMFSDGTMTAFGSNPCRFTTENFILQQSIERSKEFKKGLIKVLHVIELNEDLKFENNTGEFIKSSKETSSSCKPTNSDSVEEVSSVVKEESTSEKEISEVAEESSSAVKEVSSSVLSVEFEYNEEAKDYLEKEFGVNRGTLINRKTIVECGKNLGVDITFV